jgi:hypothetical protein
VPGEDGTLRLPDEGGTVRLTGDGGTLRLPDDAPTRRVPAAADRLTSDDMTRRLPAARTGEHRRPYRGSEAAGGHSGESAEVPDGRLPPGERPDWADRPSWAGGPSWGGSGAAAGAGRRRYPDGPARSGKTSRHPHVGRRRAPTATSKIIAQIKAAWRRSWGDGPS